MVGCSSRNIGETARIGYRDPIYPVGVFVKPVITGFKIYILKNKKAGSHANGQT
jgi:hypothetical protein